MIRKFSLGLTLVSGLVLASGAARAELVLALKAANYDSATGVWEDVADANSANQGTLSARPTLVAGQTPNGSAVVRFDGDDFLDLTSNIAPGPYTVFAYLRPDAGDTTPNNPRTIVGSGVNRNFQYRIGNGVAGEDRQNVLSQGWENLGLSDTPLSLTEFSSINVAIDATSATFRFNGADDGSAIGYTFVNSISRIGGGTGEYFRGDIAEIRIYNTVLSTAERQAVEQELAHAYANVVPEPASLATLAVGLLGVAGYARRRARRRVAASK